VVIPIHDRNPVRRVPVVTYLLILLNCAVYFLGPSLSDNGLPPDAPSLCRQDAFIQHYSAIPEELVKNQALPLTPVEVDAGNSSVTCPPYQFHKSPPLSALTSMFVHGGLVHLLGNMLFLFIFGNNVEDRMGRIGYLLFYLLCGYVAAYGFAFTDPNSTAPLIGASGAIAGVLGAYLWLYPRAKVVSLVPFLFFLPLPLPAWLVLGSWFLLQAVYANGAGVGDGSVAYMAHVVGFTVGLLLTMLYIGDRRERPPMRREMRHM
jgi:membrane associated rhomboid family serine protease